MTFTAAKTWILGAALAATMASAWGQDRVVNVYNWAEYTAPDTISGFEQATGIKARYDVFDSNDILQAKLLTGKSGYDVVVPSTHYAARQIKGGLFQKLDKSKIPNRSEEHTSELQSLMRITYAVYCFTKKKSIHTI